MIHLQIDKPTFQTATEAEAAILLYAKRCGSPVWAILQSFPALYVEPFKDVIADFAAVFSGRIFGPDGEVKWTQEDSYWSVFFTSEGGAENPVQRKDRSNYAAGFLIVIAQPCERRRPACCLRAKQSK